MQVPSAGKLTNGEAYIFYKRHDGQPDVTCPEFMTVDLHMGISARSAEDAVMKVVRTMVQLVANQQKALSNLWSQNRSKSRNERFDRSGDGGTSKCVRGMCRMYGGRRISSDSTSPSGVIISCGGKGRSGARKPCRRFCNIIRKGICKMFVAYGDARFSSSNKGLAQSSSL